MLEHVPQWLGALMTNIRAGHAKLAIVQPGIAENKAFLDLRSPAFAHEGRLPVACTADGAGISPALTWDGVPPETVSLALLVEDPDAPAPSPLVHALVWHLPPGTTQLAEGAIGGSDTQPPAGASLGRNSFFSEGWLPPDPPTGHGSHDYVFQLFALAETRQLTDNPSRGEMLDAIAGRVLAAGLLVGTYSRGELRVVDQDVTDMRPATA